MVNQPAVPVRGDHLPRDDAAVDLQFADARATAGGVVDLDVVDRPAEGAAHPGAGDAAGQAGIDAQAGEIAAGAEDPLHQTHGEPAGGAGAPGMAVAQAASSGPGSSGGAWRLMALMAIQQPPRFQLRKPGSRP